MKVSSDIKRLEKTLQKIKVEEIKLLEEFDKNIYEILGDSLVPILKYYEQNPINKEGILFEYNKKTIRVPKGFLLNFHASYIKDPELKAEYLKKLNVWFSTKTKRLLKGIKDQDNYDELIENLPRSFALSSIALTSFHRRDKMYLRDVQKIAAINLSEGNISELSTGEGKTLSAVLPLYLFALRGKGSHLITANSYLAERDYEETKPIFEGLGLSVGYLPEDINEQAIIEGLNPDSLTMKQRYDLQQKVFKIKKLAYRKAITYGSKATFAFDYLRDCSIQNINEMIQRVDNPGFAIIDEVDDCLVDDALNPYQIAGNPKTYNYNLSIDDLAAMYQEDPLKLANSAIRLGIRSTRLSYEEARYLTSTLFDDEILPDDNTYLETAHNFFSLQDIREVDNKTFNALYEPDKYDLSEIESKYGILYSKGLRSYKITDRCLEEFLKFSYLAFQINSKVILVEEQLLRDKSYKDRVDYYRDEFTGKLRLTLKGVDRILVDKNYPLIKNDFEKYLSNMNKETSIMTHFLNQVATANLLMQRDKDYSLRVSVGDSFKREILPVKNGRMAEGSRFSNGLHQALEIKEGLAREERTKETLTVSSITQKDFYLRYDLYSGMTGTSAENVFNDIYNKSTISIPKHREYEFYRKNRGEEPRQVVNKEVEYAQDTNSKHRLILSSIGESLKINQPVLLVVSDPSEIPILSGLLSKNKVTHHVLDLHIDKEVEASILAQAGLPGMVTISTDMAGRGTDIKIGGDRDTLIEIFKERHIRKLEKKHKSKLPFTTAEHDLIRKQVEDYTRGDLWSKEEEFLQKREIEKRGLKVISSGYFKINRIDRQLEGRTGRNGQGGKTERYATLEDIKKIGVDLRRIEEDFKKSQVRKDGSVELSPRLKSTIESEILMRQNNNEGNIKANIEYTQQVNKYSVELIEEYRNKRRNILSNRIPKGEELKKVMEVAADAIIADHLVNPNNNEVLSNNKGVDLNDMLLEAKEVFGITITEEILRKHNVTPSSLRNILVESGLKKINSSKDVQTLTNKIILGQNDFMIANIPYLVEASQDYKGMLTIAQGFDGQIDPLTSMRFVDNRELLVVQSCKNAVKRGLGEGLKPSDFRVREAYKDSKGGYIIKKVGDEYDYTVADRLTLVEKIRLFRNSREELNKKISKEKRIRA